MVLLSFFCLWACLAISCWYIGWIARIEVKRSSVLRFILTWQFGYRFGFFNVCCSSRFQRGSNVFSILFLFSFFVFFFWLIFSVDFDLPYHKYSSPQRACGMQLFQLCPLLFIILKSCWFCGKLKRKEPLCFNGLNIIFLNRSSVLLLLPALFSLVIWFYPLSPSLFFNYNILHLFPRSPDPYCIWPFPYIRWDKKAGGGWSDK